MRTHHFLVLAIIVAASAACSDSDDESGGDGGAGDALDGLFGPGGDGDATGGGDGDGAGQGGDGDSTPGGGPNDGDFIPSFPGAGSSDASEPLQGGELCDTVSDGTIEAVNEHTRCFFGPEDRVNPAATIEQVLECVDGVDVLHLRLTFDPNFVDNTYGDGSVGWNENRPHTNDKDLVKSDHAELLLVDGDGEVAMQFKMDYIEIDPDAPGGFSNQCVSGGDGEVIEGDPAAITGCMTSLDRNLNERGYDEYSVDSPATDENYTANPDAPEWDYRMVYEVWVDTDTFGDAGFAGAFINYVHASPAKIPESTIEVTPGECPPCQPAPDAPCAEQDIPTPGDGDSDPPPGDGPCSDGNPDTFCDTGDGPGGDDPACGDGNPDTFCSETDAPPETPPAFCELYPTDPACKPE